MMSPEHAPLEQLVSQWYHAGAPSQSLEQQNQHNQQNQQNKTQSSQ
jgi:hypothetical protein